MQDVHPDANGIPGGVDDTQTSVFKDQLFEGGDVGLLGKSLRVVRDGSRDGIAHHDDQLGLVGHAGDASGRLSGHEVAGSLLQCNLAVERPWHQRPVGEKPRRETDGYISIEHVDANRTHAL